MVKRNFKLLIALGLLTAVTFAQTISVQGVLRDPLGKTVADGYYTLTLKLYEQETGGIAIWQEIQNNIYTAHGLYKLDLGSVNPLTNVPFNTTYFLGIAVENEPEMDPRFKLLKVPSAMSVAGTQNLIPSQGNAGVGTTSPNAGLHIAADGEGDDLLKIENEAGKAMTIDPAGDLYLASGGALIFEDGSQLVSADFGGTAGSVESNDDAIITADADGNGTGRIKFYSGDSLTMVIGSSGVSIAGKTNFGLPVGTVIMFTGDIIPEGWLLCDGNEYSNSEYADLYNIIGISFGFGTGTFKVPDLRTRHVMGYDSSNDKFDTIGETGGEETHTLTGAEIPSHRHGYNPPSVTTNSGGSHRHDFSFQLSTLETEDPYDENGDGWGSVWYDLEPNEFDYGGPFVPSSLTMSGEDSHYHTATLPGGNTSLNISDEEAFNILHPYIAVNYIIKY